MTTHGEALMRAILAEPLDDLARMAYADWLEESGQDLAHAELIRVQIAMEATSAPPNLVQLRHQARAILHNLVRRWMPVDYLAPWSGEADHDGVRFSAPDGSLDCWFWRRGLLEHVYLPLAKWQEWGAMLVTHYPMRHVEISDRSPFREMLPERWGWRHELGTVPGSLGEVYTAATLPRNLWELLSGHNLTETSNWKDYHSLSDADAALSRACLEWARREAMNLTELLASPEPAGVLYSGGKPPAAKATPPVRAGSPALPALSTGLRVRPSRRERRRRK